MRPKPMSISKKNIKIIHYFKIRDFQKDTDVNLAISLHAFDKISICWFQLIKVVLL